MTIAMTKPALTTTRISGIDVATDRYVSVNGPPVTAMPSWGLTTKTADAEYHLHPAICYELHYCVPFYILVHTFNGAQGRFAVGDERLGHWVADAQGTCLIPPDLPIRIIQDTPLEFLGIGIHPERFDRVAKNASIEWRGMTDMFKTTDPALAAVCSEIRRCMIAEPLGTGDFLDALTDALLTRLVTWHLTPTSEEVEGPEILSPALARRVAQTVETMLDRPIRVAALAEEAGLSRAHFSRAFAHRFGMPPRDYIRSRRIARARAMLTDTVLSVSAIAMGCGFATPSHLTTAFRLELGLTPTAYRRALRTHTANVGTDAAPGQAAHAST
ncbi:MAG: AraC family transcriptional regulator [Pseudomonadota bacterium]